MNDLTFGQLWIIFVKRWRNFWAQAWIRFPETTILTIIFLLSLTGYVLIELADDIFSNYTTDFVSEPMLISDTFGVSDYNSHQQRSINIEFTDYDLVGNLVFFSGWMTLVTFCLRLATQQSSLVQRLDSRRVSLWLVNLIVAFIFSLFLHWFINDCTVISLWSEEEVGMQVSVGMAWLLLGLSGVLTAHRDLQLGKLWYWLTHHVLIAICVGWFVFLLLYLCVGFSGEILEASFWVDDWSILFIALAWMVSSGYLLFSTVRLSALTHWQPPVIYHKTCIYLLTPVLVVSNLVSYVSIFTHLVRAETFTTEGLFGLCFFSLSTLVWLWLIDLYWSGRPALHKLMRLIAITSWPLLLATLAGVLIQLGSEGWTWSAWSILCLGTWTVYAHASWWRQSKRPAMVIIALAVVFYLIAFVGPVLASL